VGDPVIRGPAFSGLVAGRNVGAAACAVPVKLLGRLRRRLRVRAVLAVRATAAECVGQSEVWSRVPVKADVPRAAGVTYVICSA